MLITLEVYGSTIESVALEVLLQQTHVQEQEEILTRVEWTIDRLLEREAIYAE